MRYAAHGFPAGINPYYASLMDPDDPNCPIRRQGLPLDDEALISHHDMHDPLHEDVDSPVPYITHRYPDRVLFIVTEMCPMYCRHCTRRRLVGSKEGSIPKPAIDRALDYIRGTPEIRDVLISGGDPLSLGDSRLEYILAGLRAIDHVEVIRFGTRVPVTNPFRITDEFCQMIRKYHPIWINTHFNHPYELTEEAVAACGRLADAGVPLGNQTVLLRGVNDCPHIQKALVNKLVKARVRPYYIYQCDLSEGIEHFRTPVSKGIEIIEHLRGHVSGYAVPTFVVDTPGGGGKCLSVPTTSCRSRPGKSCCATTRGGSWLIPSPITVTPTIPKSAAFAARPWASKRVSPRSSPAAKWSSTRCGRRPGLPGTRRSSRGASSNSTPWPEGRDKSSLREPVKRCSKSHGS